MPNDAYAEQYERIYPLLVARVLAREFLGAQPVGMQHRTMRMKENEEYEVSQNGQISALFLLKERGLIDAPALTAAEEIPGMGLEMPEEGGRIIELTVLPKIKNYWINPNSYEEFVAPTEQSLPMQVSSLKTLLKEKAATLGRKELHISNDEIPNGINPFLIALFMESQGLIKVDFLKPPPRYAKEPSVILKIELTNTMRVIRTNYFEYDAESETATYTDGTTKKIGRSSREGKVIFAIADSPIPLTAAHIQEISGTRSEKSPQKLAEEIISSIQTPKSGKKYPVFTKTGGWSFA